MTTKIKVEVTRDQILKLLQDRIIADLSGRETFTANVKVIVSERHDKITSGHPPLIVGLINSTTSYYLELEIETKQEQVLE